MARPFTLDFDPITASALFERIDLVAYARTHCDDETQIRTHDREYLKNVAKERNLQIDKRLDAHENTAL